MSELKPCPFCGCTTPVVKIRYSTPKTHRVHCVECKAMTDHYAMELTAIKAWNQREWNSNT